MSLLREIQSDAVDSTVDLTDVLRKCKILAARLGHEAFKKWVDQELNGYRSREELPEYRILRAHSRGDFTTRWGGGWRNYPIPPMNVPEPFRSNVATHYYMGGVASCQALVKKDPAALLRSEWPADLLPLVGSWVFGERIQCVGAWREIPANSLAGLLDTVRNRILSFVLEIEEEAPEAGEAEPGVQPLPQERVDQIFNVYIMGGSSSLALGSSDFSQNVGVNIEIEAGDLNALREHLTWLGLASEDIRELEAALKEDEPPPTSRNFGSKVVSWIGRMTAKAASGAWNITTSVAADVLAKAIASYYGWNSPPPLS